MAEKNMMVRLVRIKRKRQRGTRARSSGLRGAESGFVARHQEVKISTWLVVWHHVF